MYPSALTPTAAATTKATVGFLNRSPDLPIQAPGVSPATPTPTPTATPTPTPPIQHLRLARHQHPHRTESQHLPYLRHRDRSRSVRAATCSGRQTVDLSWTERLEQHDVYRNELLRHCAEHPWFLHRSQSCPWAWRLHLHGNAKPALPIALINLRLIFDCVPGTLCRSPHVSGNPAL